LNYVVVGMIALFAAMTMVNTIVAAMAGRRRELAQERLAGATPGQLAAMVAIESAVLATIGIVAGAVASLATIVPYSIVRGGSLLPDAPVSIAAGVAAAALVLTMAASLAASRRAGGLPAELAVAV
jgi:putative ABC transport system permease protein